MSGRAGRIALLGLLMLAAATALPACWDRREVDDLGIVLATGVDLAPGGKVRVIVHNINPSALGRGMGGMGGGAVPGAGSKPYRNRSAEGDTIFETLRDLSRQTPRQLFFAHNQVILISERLARERGLKEILDFFERNPQVRRTTWLLVGKGSLEALLDEPGRLEISPARRLFGIISERDLTSQYAVQRLGDFMEMMESEGSQPFTAVVERVPNPATPEEHRNRVPEGHISEPHQNILINGTAVFRRDRMAGWLNPKESRGLLWVTGEVRGGIIDVPNPDREDRSVSLEILRSKTKLRPEIRDGRVYLTVEIKEESNLGETMGPLDLTKPETVDRLERLLAAAIRNEVEASLAKAQQEYRVDVFGFGEAVHRKYPKQWKQMKKNWEDIFPGVQVEVQVEAKIRRTGMITKPLVPRPR